jgi:hypothetical protein
MTMLRIACILMLAAIGAEAADIEQVRSLITAFNEAALKPEPQSFRSLFTQDADYRDGARHVIGADALVSLFTNRQVFSERTAPTLRDESIRLIGPAAAFVDAQFVVFGSTVVKSGVPVVLLIEKAQGGEWKISQWRTAACLMPAVPR